MNTREDLPGIVRNGVYFVRWTLISLLMGTVCGLVGTAFGFGRWLREAWEVAQSVPTKAVVEAGFKGVEIREELTRRRIAAVASWKEQRCPKPE